MPFRNDLIPGIFGQSFTGVRWVHPGTAPYLTEIIHYEKRGTEGKE